MKHLGDITKISGFNAPVVDCVIGGSPCQDLSVAGKCAGLGGERSKLFYEQIRIIKEMREKDVRNNCKSGVAVRPRYMVWENVPGAFSSNRGEDFRTVLEETAKVADKDAVIPRPDGGKWSTSGCIMGNGWSIAWRVLDAQFWGVPQRRRRIALVADFGGQSAPEILFVRKSVCGDLEPGEPKRKTTAGNAGEGSGGAIPCTLKIRGGCEGGGKGALIQVNKNATLSTLQDQTLFQPIECYSLRSGAGAPKHEADVKGRLDLPEDSSVVYDARGNGDGKVAPTMTGDHENRITDYTGIVIHGYSQAAYDNYTEDEKTATLKAKGGGGTSLNLNNVIRQNYTVRRLTPLECERLQGYPDGWTDIGEWTDSNGKKRHTSDSSRYKALGNSIAIPPWKWVLKRLCACYERDATMASLFDGIGGFPYIWEQINGRGTCLWASEIEEFPMAVTIRRFGDEG